MYYDIISTVSTSTRFMRWWTFHALGETDTAVLRYLVLFSTARNASTDSDRTRNKRANVTSFGATNRRTFASAFAAADCESDGRSDDGSKRHFVDTSTT